MNRVIDMVADNIFWVVLFGVAGYVAVCFVAGWKLGGPTRPRQ